MAKLISIESSITFLDPKFLQTWTYDQNRVPQIFSYFSKQRNYLSQLKPIFQALNQRNS